MSTTLTNGLKLPDKGSVDWYADMQNNYTILDGAVGTVAEHTNQIAGKAPLVHTHTKSDVTDLFNSANTWSGENKYTSGFILSNISWSGVTPPSSAKPTVIEFKNADTRQGRYINRISSTSSETWIETIRNVDANTSYNHTVILKVDNSGNKSVYPSSNNDIDLGISANQWNNLYAKNVNTQSVNGVNPGALSLPDMGTTADVNYFDFISTITHLDGTDNFYTPTVDGWMTVVIAGTALSLFEDASSLNPHVQGSGVTAAPVKGYCEATIPVHKNVRVKIQAAGTSVYMAQVRPCMGNV